MQRGTKYCLSRTGPELARIFGYPDCLSALGLELSNRVNGIDGVIYLFSLLSTVSDKAAERVEGVAPAPTLIVSQLKSDSLKLSRFFILVRAFLKMRASYTTSTAV
jgi:hypothetical protein